MKNDMNIYPLVPFAAKRITESTGIALFEINHSTSTCTFRTYNAGRYGSAVTAVLGSASGLEYFLYRGEKQYLTDFVFV